MISPTAICFGPLDIEVSGSGSVIPNNYFVVFGGKRFAWWGGKYVVALVDGIPLLRMSDLGLQ